MITAAGQTAKCLPSYNEVFMSIATPQAIPPGQKVNPPSLTSEPAWEVAKLFPDQGRWSEDDYLSLETNKLVEFSNGHIEVLPMPTDYHQAIVGFLYVALLTFVTPSKLGTVRFSALKLKIYEGKFREPDVLFIKTENDDRRGNDYWRWADLVMEVVSDEYRQHDLETKRFEYAQAAIPEYWIVDPMKKEITVLTLAGDHYEVVGVFESGSRAISVLLAGFGVDVSEVFAAK
jgi:Uma2 family endonuclease